MNTVPAVVKKVYREELGREPDPAGFQFYTQKMSRDGWYESHLRKALQRSPEYANRNRSPSPRPDHNSRPRPGSTRPNQPIVISTPIPSTPLVAPPRFAAAKIPTTKASIPATARHRPVVAPRPARVAPPPPRPPATKITTRKSNASPPSQKPTPTERVRHTPPRLK